MLRFFRRANVVKEIIKQNKKENMKYIFFILMLLTTVCASAQRATIANDTAYYNNVRFCIGDTLYLGYGSTGNKEFAFVWYGNGMSGVDPAKPGFAKSELLIDKVYKQKGVVYIRCKVLDAGAQYGFKIFINLEGAIDNNELKPI